MHLDLLRGWNIASSPQIFAEKFPAPITFKDINTQAMSTDRMHSTFDAPRLFHLIFIFSVYCFPERFPVDCNMQTIELL